MGRNYIKRLLSYISDPHPLILDIGCGDGRHCLLIEKNGGKSIGIDLSEGMLREAREYYPAGDFRSMDMRNLLFDDGFFDGIWSSHVTESDAGKVVGEFAMSAKALSQ